MSHLLWGRCYWRQSLREETRSKHTDHLSGPGMTTCFLTLFTGLEDRHLKWKHPQSQDSLEILETPLLPLPSFWWCPWTFGTYCSICATPVSVLIIRTYAFHVSDLPYSDNCLIWLGNSPFYHTISTRIHFQTPFLNQITFVIIRNQTLMYLLEKHKSTHNSKGIHNTFEGNPFYLYLSLSQKQSTSDHIILTKEIDRRRPPSKWIV